MAEVIAKIKVANKNFEVLVDCEKAMSFKQGKAGKADIENVLVMPVIYTDAKKGFRASSQDLQKAFATTDAHEIAGEIIKKGSVQLTAEYRKKLLEAKRKQIIDFLARNCVDPKSGLPHPPKRIESAMAEAKVRIDEFRKAEEQTSNIIKSLQVILPIKIETRRVAIKIPPTYTAKAYGLMKEFLKKEEWQSDGSLVCIIELPAGMQTDFYEKLNNLTQGTAETKVLEK